MYQQQRRGVGKLRLFIFLLIAGGILAFAFKSGDISLPKAQPQALNTPQQVRVVVTVVLTPTPLPPTAVPTITPTPLPTATATPINMAGEWGPGDRNIQLFDLWFPKVLLVFFFAVVFTSIPYGIYVYKGLRESEMELEHERNMAQIAVEKEAYKKPEPRPIISNKAMREVLPGRVPLGDDGDMLKSHIVDFIQNVRVVGLAISKWKNEHQIPQSDIERILDFLAERGYVSERRNGVACAWLTEAKPPPMGELARVFGLDRLEVLN